MKHTLILLIVSLLGTPVWVCAQATTSIPVGKHWGIDTHVPVQVNEGALSRRINAQLQKAQAVRPHTKKQVVGMGHLTKEDLAAAEYVVTPEGDIQKGSLEACAYFSRWEQRQQANGTMSEEEYFSNREFLLLMLDIPDDYCARLAQESAPVERHRPQPAEPDEEPLAPQAILAQAPTPVIEVPQPSCLFDETAQGYICPKVSWKEITQQTYTAPALSQHKSKRRLKQLLKEHQADIEESLALRSAGKRINPGKKRLLGLYDYLCDQYQAASGKTCSPDMFN